MQAGGEGKGWKGGCKKERKEAGRDAENHLSSRQRLDAQDHGRDRDRFCLKIATHKTKTSNTRNIKVWIWKARYGRAEGRKKDAGIEG